MIKDEDKSVVVKLRMKSFELWRIKSSGYKVGSFINAACYDLKWDIDHERVDEGKLNELRLRTKSKGSCEVTVLVQLRIKRHIYEMMEMGGYNKTRFMEEAARRMMNKIRDGQVSVYTDMKMRGKLTDFVKGKVTPNRTQA